MACFLLCSCIVSLLFRVLQSFFTTLPKDKLGQLQKNRKDLKNILAYREELFNQYIRFSCVCNKQSIDSLKTHVQKLHLLEINPSLQSYEARN